MDTSGRGTASLELTRRAGLARVKHPDVEPRMDVFPWALGRCGERRGTWSESWGQGVPNTAGTG